MILAADTWPTNADLIASVHELGYLRDDDVVLDPTYGRGLWWTKWRPASLTARDRKTHPEWDYAKTDEFEPASFDAIAFDPPYVAQGGRKTIGAEAEDFTDRYGMKDCPATPEALLEEICHGMNASYALLRPGGVLLVKCKNYVSSGKLFPGVHYIWAHATMALDFEYVDEFTHVGGPGMQPAENLDGSPRRQVHARQNASTLFVFRKPGRRRKRRAKPEEAR